MSSFPPIRSSPGCEKTALPRGENPLTSTANGDHRRLGNPLDSDRRPTPEREGDGDLAKGGGGGGGERASSLNRDSPREASRQSRADDDDDEAVSAPAMDNMTSIYLPKINYVTLMLGRETEPSADMESLALKYLKVSNCRLR